MGLLEITEPCVQELDWSQWVVWTQQFPPQPHHEQHPQPQQRPLQPLLIPFSNTRKDSRGGIHSLTKFKPLVIYSRGGIHSLTKLKPLVISKLFKRGSRRWNSFPWFSSGSLFLKFKVAVECWAGKLRFYYWQIFSIRMLLGFKKPQSSGFLFIDIYHLLILCADDRLGIDFPFFWVLKSSCSQSNCRAIA